MTGRLRTCHEYKGFIIEKVDAEYPTEAAPFQWILYLDSPFESDHAPHWLPSYEEAKAAVDELEAAAVEILDSVSERA